ncbi:MAG TPA: O-antigen ligase family protein [Stellaceae bacterium]|nr:O-antigen ligase family protein [Stellaceae bacterium]
MIGAAYATYGLIALKTGQVRWLDVPSVEGRVTSTFVNHNSFAAYAGIALIATAALLVGLYQGHAIAGGSWRLRLAAVIEISGGPAALLIACAFIILAALLMTGSRGGILATGAGLVTLSGLVLLRRRAPGRGRPLSGIAIVGSVGAVALLCFGSLLLNNLGERGLSDSNRLAVYVLTLRSILDAPFFGFGYGTFSNVFPLYRDRSISVAGVWGQAHDSYLEVLQGLGLPVGTMLIAVFVLLALRCLRGAIHRQENATAPQVAAGVICLVGVHSLADFSVQMQAVALTFMAVLGAGVAQATSSRVEIGD